MVYYHIEMERSLKSCLQLSMKIVNSVIGMVGIAMIMYGLWLIRVWQRDTEESSSDDQTSFPWFIHGFLALGISFCAITCLGHVAADTAYAHFLSCYVPIMFLLLLLNIAMMADVFLNSKWEKDLPEDPTGKFDDFKDFVNSNKDVSRWVAMLIVLAQGVSILLATVLKTLETDLRTYYYHEDYYAPSQLPSLNTQIEHLPCVAGGPYCAFGGYC